MCVPIFDTDNHMYETREVFTKFLPLNENRYEFARPIVEEAERGSYDLSSLTTVPMGAAALSPAIAAHLDVADAVVAAA